MRKVHGFAVMAIAAACALPCQAEPLSPPAARLDAQLEAFERGEWLKGLVTEQDVSLFFEHLRAHLLAQATGARAPSSEELNRRAEAIGRELRARGMVAGLLLLTVLEAQARELVREAPRAAPPPAASPPFQR